MANSSLMTNKFGAENGTRTPTYCSVNDQPNNCVESSQFDSQDLVNALNKKCKQQTVQLFSEPTLQYSISKNNVCRTVTIVLLLVLISVLVSCFVMLVLFRYSNVVAPVTKAKISLDCVPCLESNTRRMEQVDVKLQVEQNCCLLKPEFIETILRPVQRNISGDALQFSKVSNSSLHVFLDRKNVDSKTYKGLDETDYEQVTDWTADVTSAFTRPFARLSQDRDEIYVKDSGVYVIYSRLEFNGPPINSSEQSLALSTDPVLFGQQIRQKDYALELLEDSQMKTCISDEEGTLPCYTSHLFATLHLPRGSRLSVHAKPICLISDNVRNSYFGLFRIY